MILIPLIYMCKMPDRATLVEYWYFIGVSSDSNELTDKNVWYMHLGA